MKRLLLCCGAALALGACDLTAFDEALDDFRVILSIESQSTVVGGLVVDARTGDLVEAPVELVYAASVDGAAVDGAVVDGFGDPIGGETVEGGAFNFAVSDDVAPGPGREVEVEVTATADGYEPTTELVVLADTGSYSVTLQLERPPRPPPDGPPPASTDPVIATGTVRASGAAGTDGRFVLEATPRGAGPTTVTFERGSVLEGDGGPLSGAVEVELRAFSPVRSRVLSPRLPDGVVVAGFQVSAATPSRAAVSGPARVRLVLEDGALDPDTGRPFEVGDTVEAYAYDPASRSWLEAGTATVAERLADGAVALEGVYERLGLFTVLARRDPPTVAVTVRVERNGNGGPVGIDARGVGYRTAATVPDGETSVTLELPANPRRTRLRASHNGRRYTPPDPTTCLDCRVSLIPPSRPVTVTLTPACPSRGERVYIDNLPTFTLSVREQGTNDWFSVGDVDRVNRRADGSLESVVIVAEGLLIGITYWRRAPRSTSPSVRSSRPSRRRPPALPPPTPSPPRSPASPTRNNGSRPPTGAPSTARFSASPAPTSPCSTSAATPTPSATTEPVRPERSSRSEPTCSSSITAATGGAKASQPPRPSSPTRSPCSTTSPRSRRSARSSSTASRSGASSPVTSGRTVPRPE